MYSTITLAVNSMFIDTLHFFCYYISEVDILKKSFLSYKFLIILIIPAVLFFDIIACIILYFFEPIAYDAPDLSLSDYSFDLYSKYDDSDSDFFIKQISDKDIVSVEDDVRLKYVNDTVLIFSDNTVSYDDIQILISPYNGKICGYIKDVNFYQAEFPDSDYPTLLNICSVLSDNENIVSAIVDYFEETPLSNEEITVSDTYEINTYYYDLINFPDDISSYNTSEITVGILDVLIDSESSYLNVINKDSYKVEFLNNSLISSFNNHGTHVAGILCAKIISDAPGICPDAKIVSDNGLNNSVSYWIASIADMIINYNAKVINMSLGYNSYIPLSATLACEETLNYIQTESSFFCTFFQELINDGHEFVICVAAGNDSGSVVNKISGGFFSFGEKNILNKLDLFDFFTEKVNMCDSQYSLPLNSIENTDVRNRIIVVGSCDMNKKYSSYSNSGDRIDIVAPGEMIYSLSINDEYEYNSGTSMATPFVSGTAALLFAVDNSLSGEEVKNIIVSSATDYVYADEYSYPLLNISNALDKTE